MYEKALDPDNKEVSQTERLAAAKDILNKAGHKEREVDLDTKSLEAQITAGILEDIRSRMNGTAKATVVRGEIVDES